MLFLIAILLQCLSLCLPVSLLKCVPIIHLAEELVKRRQEKRHYSVQFCKEEKGVRQIGQWGREEVVLLLRTYFTWYLWQDLGWG